MGDKKGLFALKKATKKRVHRISCSPFCRQSYPTPIPLGDWWQQARNTFHFLPSSPDPPPSPLLPPSNVSNPLSSDKSSGRALTKLSWILCLGCGVAVWQGLTRPISLSRHRRRNGPWCCPAYCPWQTLAIRRVQGNQEYVKESSQ